MYDEENRNIEQENDNTARENTSFAEVNFVMGDAQQTQPLQAQSEPQQALQAQSEPQQSQQAQVQPQPQQAQAQGSEAPQPQPSSYYGGQQAWNAQAETAASGSWQSSQQAGQNRQAGGYGYQSQSSSGYQGYYSQTNGQTYQQYQPQTPPQAPKKKKKDRKPGLFKKTAGIVAAALLFGFVSGGTMVGVNMLADSMEKETEPPQTVSESVQQYPTLSEEEMDRIASRINRNAAGGQTVAMDVSDIVEEAMPSVVAINNTMFYQSVNPWFGRPQTYEVPSAGSGIIVGQNDTELLIATNNHVVENANELSVVFIDDTELEASIKGTDSESDLAIVAVPLDTIPADTMNKIAVADLGDSEELKIGQGVIAIGNALGYGQAVTVGYVSALNREVQTDGSTKHLIQTDAAINPGNSGGALLNMEGQVIGINEAKYSDTDVEGMGFAIPISQAQEILDTLMVRRSGEKVNEDEAGYLGIQGVTVDDTMQKQLDMPAGVYVYRIVEGGAAEKTDLHEKDVITKFDGQRVMTMASLQDLLKYYKKGETVELVVESLTDGEYVERTITITLGAQVSAD